MDGLKIYVYNNCHIIKLRRNIYRLIVDQDIDKCKKGDNNTNHFVF